MLKGQEIKNEISEKMRAIGESNKGFVKTAMKIDILLAEIRVDDLDYKKEKPQENPHIMKIIDLVSDSVTYQHLSAQEAHDILMSVNEMRRADFEYTMEFLDKLKGSYDGIVAKVHDLQDTLDRACGKKPQNKQESSEVSQNSFMKAIGNIFKMRKSTSSEENKEKIKLK